MAHSSWYGRGAGDLAAPRCEASRTAALASATLRREPTEIASPMMTIKALAPGLYAMKLAAVEGEGARQTLPELLPRRKERKRAVRPLQYIVGPLAEMEPRTLANLQRLSGILELPPASEDVTDDLLANPDPSPLEPLVAE